MTLDEHECWTRLVAARHGVLATIHPARGVDAVPVVITVIDRQIVIPIDRVKPKVGLRLQRLANLEQDDRCVLLVDHYDDDWLQLWWVRVHARGTGGDVSAALAARLALLFPAYGPPGSVSAVITLQPTEIRGWSARTTAPPGAAG